MDGFDETEEKIALKSLNLKFQSNFKHYRFGWRGVCILSIMFLGFSFLLLLELSQEETLNHSVSYHIWDRLGNVSFDQERSQYEKTHPQLAFIQPIINNALSVSYTLDRIAYQYGIKVSRMAEVDNVDFPHDIATCHPPKIGDISGDIWYHGGPKRSWMTKW